MKRHITLLLLTSLACARAANLTWDADTALSGPQDSIGTWVALTSNTNWWNGSGNVTWNNATPDNAVIGAGIGAAGTVTIPSNTTNTVGNITFNTSAGDYTIAGSSSTTSKLNLSGTPTIFVTNGQSPIITVVLMGTTFNKAGPGALTINPANPVLTTGSTLVSEGTLTIGGSSSGRLIIPGDLTVTNGAILRLGASDVIIGNATVTLRAGCAFNMLARSVTVTTFVLDGATVSQSSTETLTVIGNFDARSGSMSGGTGKLDAGSLTKSTAGTVTLGARGSSTLNGLTSTIVNEGTLILDYTQNSSKLKDAGTLAINGGTLVFANGSHIEEIASFVMTNGVITNAAGSVSLSLPSGNYDVRSGSIYTALRGAAGLIKSTPGTVTLGGINIFAGDTRIGDGTLTLANGSALDVTTLDMNPADSGGLSFGALTSVIVGGLKGSRNLTLQNASSAAVQMRFGGNGQTTTYSGVLGGTGSIVTAGAGTITLTAVHTYSGVTSVSGAGKLLVDGTIGPGGVFVGGGVTGGTLGGNGTITGPVFLQLNGRLSPGSSIGVLTVSNSVDMVGGSTNLMELDKAAGTNDLIRGITTLTYGGTLSVTNLNGTLAAGDSFKLYDAATYGGSFTNITPATPGANLVWDISSLTNNGTLKVAAAIVASSRPRITSIVVSGSSAIIAGTNGPATSNYFVRSSTDIGLARSNWTALQTNQFDGSGNFTFTNAYSPSDSQRFYLIQVP